MNNNNLLNDVKNLIDENNKMKLAIKNVSYLINDTINKEYEPCMQDLKQICVMLNIKLDVTGKVPSSYFYDKEYNADKYIEQQKANDKNSADKETENWLRKHLDN